MNSWAGSWEEIKTTLDDQTSYIAQLRCEGGLFVFFLKTKKTP